MKRIKAALLLLTVLLSGCAEIAPCGFDKEQYLDNFKRFIDKAEEMDTKAGESAWSSMDERFEKLSEECMEQWEDEMSIGEKAKVAGWILRYNYIRMGKPFFQ